MSNSSDYIKCKFCDFKVKKWRTDSKGKKRGPHHAGDKVVIHALDKHMDLPEVKAMYKDRMEVDL